MKELGLYLKKQREQKKITLEEVSVATKIGIKVLQALENGEEDKLPPKPFVRGFIISYARYLGLDPQETLDMYQKSVSGSTPPTNTLAIPESTKKVERALPGGVRSIITVALIIIMIIAIVFFQRILSKREAEMRGEVSAITGNSEPLNLKASPTAAPSSSPTEGVLSAIGSPTPSTSPTATSTATPAPEKAKPTATPTATPTAAPTPAPAAPSPVAAAGSAEAKSSPSPAGTPAPSPTAEPQAIPQEVIVEALDKVTLKVTIDNKGEKEVTLNADQIQTFKAKAKIKIYTPDGGAISVIQNGFDLGVPGNLGQPKTMVFPK